MGGDGGGFIDFDFDDVDVVDCCCVVDDGPLVALLVLL